MESELTKSLLAGVLEGLTEFIPVSSTGHLILLGESLEFQGPVAATFDIFIQLGAILAVVVLYWPRFIALLDFSHDDNTESFCGRSGILKLFVACLPAFVLGFLLHDFIKAMLFSSTPVAAALIFGGVVMIFIEQRDLRVTAGTLEHVSYRQAFLVGCFQCLALWPGMSRSGATIIGGMICGLSRSVAAEFSFLVAVPVMFAAVSYDMLKSYHYLSAEHVTIFTIGFIVSFVTALVAIKFFISFVQRYTLSIFGVYRILLGLVVFAVLSDLL
jgi:undecaprenyl-diphosphatase